MKEHAANCAINVMRSADDSTAYLSEKCTCEAPQTPEDVIRELEHVIETLAVWWCDHPDEYAVDDVDNAVGAAVDGLRESARCIRSLLQQARTAEQLIADVLAEHADDLTKDACYTCEDCGPVVMCRFHSVLSALSRHTWTTPAIERDNLKRENERLKAQIEQARTEKERVTTYTPILWATLSEDERYAEYIRVRTALAQARTEKKALAFLEREGYRRCDIPACNCGSWHKFTG